MSPTEDELRAALHLGEGDALDADGVIRRAQAQGAAIRDRRVRLASAAAVVAVVAGLGVGGGLILSRGSQTHSADRNAMNVPAPSAGGGKAAGNAGGGTSSAAAACPDAPPSPTTPPQGVASLFPGSVNIISVCLYSRAAQLEPKVATNPQPNLVILGADVQRLVTSIDAASTVRQALPCPLYRTAAVDLVLIGVRPDGTALPPVVTQYRQNPCNLAITNGTAIRYNWPPPAWFASELDRYLSTVPTH